MTPLSIFGSTGFIGSAYIRKHGGIAVPRNSPLSYSQDVLYFISTNHNYNVFDNPHLDIDTNLTQLISVLDKYKTLIQPDKNACFNFISSWFVYGQTTELPAKETSVCYPSGFYSITKKCAEDLLKSYCQTFGLNYRILRLCNIIGEQDTKFSAKKNSLQYLLNRIVKNQQVDLYDGGDFIRDYLYIDDCINGIHQIVNNAPINETYNIGSGQPMTFANLINHAVKFTESKSQINNIKTPEFHKICQVKNMWLDISKARQYGFDPQHNIYEKIEQICKHYHHILTVV